MRIFIYSNISTAPNTLVIPISQQDGLKNRLAAMAATMKLPSSLLQEDFKANHKEIHTFYVQNGENSQRVFLLGLGKKPGFAEVLAAFRSFAFKRKDSLSNTLAVSFLDEVENTPVARWAEAAINGILLGRYEIGRFKTKEKEATSFLSDDLSLEFFLPKAQLEAGKKAIERGHAVAETQLQIFDLVNAPSNKKTPQVLADWAQKSGEEHHFQVTVFQKEAIQRHGLHALLAVNRGSEFPPTFTIMEYKPDDSVQKNYPIIGLVGKGVTFDTGGLSIKPSTNMHYMKSDMGGAAAVFGAMELTAKLKLPIHLIGIVPATDNSVDANSIKPSDVISSYSGKSIEVIDTDAEGRLILADGLAYLVKNYKPQVLIDLATLTGSCIRTLGNLAGGLFTKDDTLSAQLLQSSEQTGERLWRLPLWDDYSNYIKSDVADVKNFSGKPTAGAITAAKFLEMFTSEHPSWAHLDIAGVAVSDSEFSNQKSATAFGVRLLIEYLSALSK